MKQKEQGLSHTHTHKSKCGFRPATPTFAGAGGLDRVVTLPAGRALCADATRGEGPTRRSLPGVLHGVAAAAAARLGSKERERE